MVPLADPSLHRILVRHQRRRSIQVERKSRSGFFVKHHRAEPVRSRCGPCILLAPTKPLATLAPPTSGLAELISFGAADVKTASDVPQVLSIALHSIIPPAILSASIHTPRTLSHHTFPFSPFRSARSVSHLAILTYVGSRRCSRDLPAKEYGVRLSPKGATC